MIFSGSAITIKTMFSKQRIGNRLPMIFLQIQIRHPQIFCFETLTDIFHQAGTCRMNFKYEKISQQKEERPMNEDFRYHICSRTITYAYFRFCRLLLISNTVQKQKTELHQAASYLNFVLKRNPKRTPEAKTFPNVVTLDNLVVSINKYC